MSGFFEIGGFRKSRNEKSCGQDLFVAREELPSIRSETLIESIRADGVAGLTPYGVRLRHGYTKAGKIALIRHQRYEHA